MVYGSIGNSYVRPTDSCIVHLYKDIELRCQRRNVGIFYISNNVIYNLYCLQVLVSILLEFQSEPLLF